MPSIVIVTGPQGCGKTRNKDALKEMFQAQEVIDNWQGNNLPILQCLTRLTSPKYAPPLSAEEADKICILALCNLHPDDLHMRFSARIFREQGASVRFVSFFDVAKDLRTPAVDDKAPLSRRHKITLVCVHSSAGDDLLTPERTSTIYRLALSQKLPILTDLDPADPASVNMLKMVSPMFGDVYAFVHGREQAASQLAAQLAHSDLDVGIVTLN